MVGFRFTPTHPTLAISYSKLGDIHQALGEVDKALEFFELDIELTKELYESNPKKR